MTACPSCSQDSVNIFAHQLDNGINIKISQCSQCNLVFNNSDISQSILKNFIEEEYYKSKDVGFSIDKRFVRHFTRRAKQHKKLILKCFPENFKGNVLDVGCGAGYFLHEMKKNSWNSFGIEPSNEHYLYAVNNLDIKVYKGMFDEYKEKTKFDLIYFSHVFDDLPNLDKTFKKISFLLKSNGRIFIEVPNYNRDKEFNLVKKGDFIENHYYFTIESVKKVFNDHGYNVEYLETYESIYLNTFLQYLLSPYELIKRYIIPDAKKEQIRLIAVKK